MWGRGIGTREEKTEEARQNHGGQDNRNPDPACPIILPTMILPRVISFSDSLAPLDSLDDLLRARRGQKRQEKAITDCTDFTDRTRGEDIPGSGEEAISPGFVPSGLNPSPLLLFICGICDLPSFL
jgi:hypothetical protein